MKYVIEPLRLFICTSRSEKIRKSLGCVLFDVRHEPFPEPINVKELTNFVREIFRLCTIEMHYEKMCLWGKGGQLRLHIRTVGQGPASILYKSTAGRPVSYPDGPITARCRFIKNAYWGGGGGGT